MLALLGQHHGFGTNALVNVTPFAASLDLTAGIARS
jgi:hypothetical protein